MIFFLFFNFSCKNKYYSQSEQKLKEVLSDVYSKIDEKSKIDSAVDEYLSSLSLVQRISQLFIINLEGNERFIPVEFEYEVSKEKKDSNHKTVQPQKRSNVRNKSKAKGKRRTVRRK